MRINAFVRRTQVLLLAGLVCFAVGGKCGQTPAVPPHDIENISNSPDTVSNYPFVACSDDGRVVLAWSDYVTGYEEVWLVEKERGGQWTEPFNLSNAGNVNGSRRVSLCFGHEGTLHAAWSQFVKRGPSGFWGIAYTRRPVSGEWAVPETIRYGTAVEPYVGVDGQGRVHLLFQNLAVRPWELCYTARDPAGTWRPVEVVDNASAYRLHVFPDGRCLMLYNEPHVWYQDVYWLLQHPDGTRDGPHLLIPSGEDGAVFWFGLAGTDSQAYGVFGGGDLLRFMTFSLPGEWSAPDSTWLLGAGAMPLATNNTGDIAVVVRNPRNAQLGAAWREAGGWSRPVIVIDQNIHHQLALAPDGTIHLTWVRYDYDWSNSDIRYVHLKRPE